MNGEQFEEEVRKYARAIYSSSAYIGRDEFRGVEFDLKIENNHEVIFIECTQLEKLDKTVHDAKKISSRISAERQRSEKQLRGIIVTFKEPTQHQKAYIRDNYLNIEIVSFDAFKRRLIDPNAIVERRNLYRFGSNRNALQNSIHFDENKYIHQTLFSKNDWSELNTRFFIDNFIHSTGLRHCIVGDFGIGKSTFLRMIYKRTYKAFFSGDYSRFPIYINLDEHKGQITTAEALLRHAEIALGDENFYPDLVRTLRMGGCDLILDGFDELSSISWNLNPSGVRNNRYTACTLIREFIQQSPRDINIIIAGRDNYFDADEERDAALGTTQNNTFQLLDWDDQQLDAFISVNNRTFNIPNWLPRRPLLVSYLTAKDIIQSTSSDTGNISGRDVWIEIVSLISRREHQQDKRFSPDIFESLYKRLGTLSRKSIDGRGRFTLKDIEDAFEAVSGARVDETSASVLLKLAGLSGVPEDDGRRAFFDIEFADALKAFELVEFIKSPYTNLKVMKDLGSTANCSFSETTEEMCRLLFQNIEKIEKLIEVAHNRAISESLRRIASELSYLAIKMNSKRSICVDELELRSIVYDAARWFDGWVFQTCLIDELNVIGPISHPNFVRHCLIGNLICRNKDSAEIIARSDNSITQVTARGLVDVGVRDANLDRRKAVLLTILKRVFFQSGSGRLRTALYRGLDQAERSHVDELVSELAAKGFVQIVKNRGDEIVVPRSEKRRDAGGIIADPDRW